MYKTSKAASELSTQLPILYSLRNCPYAMRARIAIFKAKQTIELRDVVLSNKPDEMIAVSPKATVPVLVLNNGRVIDESLEVMLWALKESDPDNLLHYSYHSEEDSYKHNNEKTLSEMLTLIHTFDDEFKVRLEKYKCAKRYKEASITECRVACEKFIQVLENRLTSHLFLMSDQESLIDIALLPFIRQFARVERQWYLQSPYPRVKQWLNNYLQSPMFTKVMAKYPLWLDNHEVVLFGGAQK
jgi:glutathione S-transferase